MTDPRPELTMRERVAVRLILLMVQIISPWKFSHQFDEALKAIKEEL
jgi:hypothetical protein